MRRKFSSIIITLLILSITYFISSYWMQFTLIEGESMSPTLVPNSLVIVDKHTKTFEDGDVIVFYSSNVHSICIKRIIASPNKTIEIKNGLIYVNNIESPFQRPDTHISYSGTASDKIQMSNEQYFVIGDNYEHSTDSRYSEIGIISRNNIIGKVIFPSAEIN